MLPDKKLWGMTSDELVFKDYILLVVLGVGK
jgi:hypothetical protein